MSMVESTKILCPLYDEMEISIPDDSRAFSYLCPKCEILIRYRKKIKMTLLKQFIKLEWMRKGL